MNPNTQQGLTIVLPLLTPLATLAILMAGFLNNNSRLNDLRDMLRAGMKVLRTIMEKNHSEILARFAGLENRVSRLEHS